MNFIFASGIIPVDVFNGLDVDDSDLLGMDFPDLMGVTSPTANAPHFSVGDDDGRTNLTLRRITVFCHN